MNRAMLIEMGLTDEQIEKIMSENGKSINAEKAKAEGYKTDALKAQELLKTIESMKKADADKDKVLEGKDKDYENLQKQVADMQKQLKQKELKAQLADKGIVGENADKLIESLGDGSIDIELLGNIIAEREGSAVDKKVKELEGNATNPNGGKVGKSDDKSDAEVLAQNIGKSLAESNKASTDVLAQYI